MSLSQAEKDAIERKLRSDYDSLVAEVRDELERSGEQHFIDLAGRVMDMGDQSVADALADLDAAMIDRHVRELREIESALKRIADGSYGQCVECGAEVGIERLKAYPTAQRCFDCQSMRDKQFAHESHPRL